PSMSRVAGFRTKPRKSQPSSASLRFLSEGISVVVSSQRRFGTVLPGSPACTYAPWATSFESLRNPADIYASPLSGRIDQEMARQGVNQHHSGFEVLQKHRQPDKNFRRVLATRHTG